MGYLLKELTVKSGFVLVVLMLLLLGREDSAWAGIPTEVTLNRSIILDLPKKVERVSLAASGIADIVMISPRQVQLNGVSIGQTTMLIWEEGGGPPRFYDVKVNGDASSIEERLRQLSMEYAKVEFAQDTVVLSGKTNTTQSRLKAEGIAHAYSPKVINQIEVAAPPTQQVLLQVKVAQIDKSSLKRLGISAIFKGNSGEGFFNTVGRLTGAVTGNGKGTDDSVSRLGGFNPADAFQAGISHFPSGVGVVLQALATKGYAKILAEPNLLVKSGQEGNFLAGSKIPYNVVESIGGAATTSVVWQEVGIKLKFKPQVQDDGIIQLKIDPAEVSSIAGTLAVNGYPIIDTRTVQTSVELKDGESLVLAGLLQEETIKAMSKIPMLGDIPILGALFRSTRNEVSEKELVFFVTPKLVQPLAPGVKSELPAESKLSPEQEREFDWIPMAK